MNAPAVIRRWRADPVAFVREVFRVEPDAWQRDVLVAYGRGYQRIAMKACKGPGKTTVLSWIAWHFLVTRLHPKVIATSITGDNLADGLWTEMAKWRNASPFLKQAFEWTKTAIVAKDHAETWWMVARTWPKGGDANQQADTLAGKHADAMMFILDEAGGIPDAVMAAAEAGLANAVPGSGREAFIVIAGNPTHLEGPLYRACTTERDLWHVTEITSDPDDPKRTPRVSVEWARAQIAKYGRDNPWVLVNVFGRFPPSSLNALLGPDEVRKSMNLHLREDQYSFAARVLGVDVARDGGDTSVLFPRQGLAAGVPTVLRGVSSTQGAGIVARIWKDTNADACFVDDTGGFGAGWIDYLRLLGRTPIGVPFAGKAHDPARFANKRAEIHFAAAQWVKEGGALPNDPELLAELTATTYTFQGDRFLLEPKEDIKIKLGRSPDKADALALTFAHPVQPKTAAERLGLRSPASVKVYNPFDALKRRT